MHRFPLQTFTALLTITPIIAYDSQVSQVLSHHPLIAMIAISPLLLLLALLLALVAQRVPSNEIDLAVLSTNGIRALTVQGAAAGDELGWSVSGAGDVNGDGYADIIVSSPHASPNGKSEAGAVLVLFGKNDTGFATLDALNFTSGNSTGFIIQGADAEDLLGYSVSGAGDVNGDGYADVIVGAYKADPNGDRSGAAYVIFGMKDGFATVDLASFSSGLLGFIIWGAAASDYLGCSVSGAGDMNNDGYSDVIVGAYGADSLAGTDSQHGKAYVISE
jgi:hypothetical protein